MEFIEEIESKRDNKRILRKWAKFLCSYCFQIVERPFFDGKKQKSCGCVQYKLSAQSNTGKKRTEETKGKMRKIRKYKYIKELNPFYGKKHTEESRQKMREAKIGHIVSEESKKKNSVSHKGKKASEETRQNMAKEKRGELNPNWKNGKSFEIYPQEFNKELKQFILERDNYTCQCPDCKIINPKKLDIHHIDYDKKNNNPENLITLCSSCHMKTNFNRQYWIEFYQNIIIGIN